MNILTFDIEDWFHILGNESTRTVTQWANYESRIHQNMNRILDFLDETDQKATFFCLGWIAEKYPEVIREIDKRGFEIGSHSYMHQLIFEQSRKEYRDDLNKSISILENMIGKKVKSFRAPGFSLTADVLWVFDELAEQGIEYDSSIFPARRAHGGISGFSIQEPHLLKYNGHTIKEFPLNVKTIFNGRVVFSGGGYFRILPYHVIKRWTTSSSYVMTYFHPRDFDKKQPLIEGLSSIRKFKSYYGLGTAFRKLKRYTSDFDFTDLSDAENEIEWDKAPIIRL